MVVLCCASYDLDQFEDLGVDGRMTLRRDLQETGWEGMDWIWQRIERQIWCCYEHGNEASGSIKCRGFLD
jgi:hypothetical protein